MTYFYVKAIHIIFVVTWFAALFYLPRLLVYHREANDYADQERTVLLDRLGIMMQKLLYAIAWPSAVLTLIFGGWMLYLYHAIPSWLVLKIGFVMLLYAYHFSLHFLVKKQLNHTFTFSSYQLRIWNEVPTVLLFSIVMLVVVKQNISVVYGLLGLFLLIAILLFAIRLYRRVREKN